MAKTPTVVFERATKPKRRHKPKALWHQKKLGPKSSERKR